MLKRTITYEDYDGNKIAEDSYLKLSKVENVEGEKMYKNCEFCEHRPKNIGDGVPDECDKCHWQDNFQLKKNMSQRERYHYEMLSQDLEWVNDKECPFDLGTAKMVLDAIAERGRPCRSMHGNLIFAIDWNRYNLVRQKFLGR